MFSPTAIGNSMITSRRSILTALGIGFSTSLSGCSANLAGDPVSVEWKQQIPPDMGSFAVVEGMIYVGAQDGLHIINGETGDKEGANRFASAARDIYGVPVIDDGVAYYGSIDGQTNAVYAVDTAGKEQWSTDLSNSVVSCAVDDDLVYVATGAAGEDSGLSALEKSSGDVIWSIDLDEYPVAGSPIVHDDQILLQSGGIAAFDTEIGELLWRYERSVDSHRASVSRRPVVEGSLVCCTFVGESDLFVVDIETGDLVWKTNTGTDLSSPAVSDGVAYVGTTAMDLEKETAPFYAYDFRNEEAVWSAEIGWTSSRGAAVSNEHVYATGGAGNATIYALEGDSGDRAWTYKLDITSISHPVVDDSRIYVSGSTGGDRYLFGLASK